MIFKKIKYFFIKSKLPQIHYIMPYHSNKSKITRYSKNISSSSSSSIPYSELSITDKIKALDIVMYSSPGCFFCIQFKDLLKKENLFHHITIIEDQSKMPSNVQAFPHLTSKKTGKHIVGAPRTINAMLEELKE